MFLADQEGQKETFFVIVASVALGHLRCCHLPTAYLLPTYCLPTAYLLPTYIQPIQCLQYNLFPYIFSTGKKEDELCAGNLQRQLFVHTHFCNVLTNTSGS